MVLRAGLIVLAQKLQEASDRMHSEVASKLRDAVNDAHRGTGKWGNYIDHSGDGDSGDCIYSCDGDIRSAPYTIGTVGGKSTTNIDMANSKNVVPHVSYDEEADDDDHYTAMESAKLYQPGIARFCERFISKDERDKADASSFAGKGKSFPILKPADVSAAVHAMGRAGSDNYGPAQLKANIIRIAKAKGWTSELPKAWQSGGDDKDAKEAAKPGEGAALKLVENLGLEFLAPLKVSEAARTNYPIKIMSPGTGSSAHYPASVVEKAAPLVKPGTLMFWNHSTQAEEAARPEGDLNNLAAIITGQGKWDANGAKGPGIYAEAKVMADYAQKVEERAPHIGVSIRASGTPSGRTVDGKPELKSIDHIESVDYVTKAGRGGMALAEAARNAGILIEGDDDMSEDEKKRLLEAARKVELYEAREVCRVAIADMSLIEAGKSRAIDNVLRQALPMKDGVLDTAKLQEAVKAEAKREGEYIAALCYRGVNGMGLPGSAPLKEVDKKEEKRLRKEAKRLAESQTDVFGSLMGDPKAAEFAAHGRAA